MKEKNNFRFYDMSCFVPTQGIKERCRVSYLSDELKKRFPDETFTVTSAEINDSGIYRSRANIIEKAFPFLAKLKELPDYCDVRITVQTGKVTENIIVWSPVLWNERFLGTAGGGTGTGGLGYFTKPDNTSRGINVPYAIMNGFSSATADANNVNAFDDRMINPETNELNRDYYENWRSRTTHDMARFGKAVTEILHNKPIKHSYMNGGSGGGRQCMVEVQEHPGDFDGVWASCPAINWCKFVPESYFILEVLEKHGNKLNPQKIKFFAEKARESVGGDEVYYKLKKRIDFDTKQLIGQKTKGGVITKDDAEAMNEIWNGPRRENGERMWHGFYPGGIFWNVGIPVGAFYYSALSKKAQPFYLSTVYLRWVLKNPKAKKSEISQYSFEELFDKSLELYGDCAADNADLSEFAKHGKLIIDHGTDDPLIPVDGTIEYYRKIRETMGADETDKFFRLFVMPGDSHGNCRGKGGGMTASEGLKALINWVENGTEPETVNTIRVNMKGETLSKGQQTVWKEES